MSRYVIKTFDAFGRLVGRAELRAADDWGAARVLRGFRDDRAHELWCGNRRVESLPSRGLRPFEAGLAGRAA